MARRRIQLLGPLALLLVVSTGMLVWVAGRASAPVLRQGERAARAAPTQAGVQRAERPFLWRIEGPTPSYLFGTIHVVDERVAQLHPLAAQAFAEAEAVFTEIHMVDDEPAQSAAMTLPEGKSLESVLPPALLARLDARLARLRPAMDREWFPELYPLAWMLMLPVIEESLNRPDALNLDTQLATLALRAGKTVGGLEKPEEQCAVMTAFTDVEQAQMFEHFMDYMDEVDAGRREGIDALIDIYLAGEVERLEEWLEAQLTPPTPDFESLAVRYRDELLYKRNLRIAQRIEQLLTSEAPDRRHVFAIGVGHLVGPNTVQDALRSRGFHCTLVVDELFAELKPEIEALAQPLFGASETFVRNRGAFLPHGAVLEADGEVRLVMAAAGDLDALHAPAEVLPLLHKALRDEAEGHDLAAVAVCEDVTITPAGQEPTRAVKVLVEHRRGLTVALYLPWKRKPFGDCDFGEIVARVARPEVQPWGEAAWQSSAAAERRSTRDEQAR